MSREDTTHGSAPLSSVDPEPLHQAVDALSAALHEYVELAVGVRAEFGAAEADDDPRILASEERVGSLNAQVFDTIHDALGMHPDLTSSVWEAPAAAGDGTMPAPTAEPFYLGFLVTPLPSRPDAELDGVLDALDSCGGDVVARLADAGFDTVEWAASRGDAAGFAGDDEEDDDE